ncbi:glutamate ABC transporter substrate-binding protein [Actinacidiphila sp. ITFR-21]|uniref:glutamate ABC transporter substrate-binding protein n=1 Tax=Actinacidiphila sp. ITFR-21 TaxID=3075199 RepID=UPI00288C30A0|nr:glutamate ABC transporter substrate-binding protein [Streptomyces sp. ITFR-21]WNI15523.1 glutamate ABC transporter substrate-binding protein [Streptomyces sp. ITFR-21]
MNGSWRGWGGVAAMAAACGLALTCAVAPLHGDSGTGQAKAAHARGAVVQARYASAQDAAGTCTPANMAESLDPALGDTDGAAVRAIVKRGRLVVGIDQDSYLWGFRDPKQKGRLAGFDIDITRAIAKGILGDPDKVQYLAVPTAERFPAIEHGDVDMVVRTVSITCARLHATDYPVVFSTAYFNAGQQLLVPDGSAVTGYDESLRGKRVCVADGAFGETTLTGKSPGKESDAERFGAKVVTVDNQLDCLVLLQLDKADAVFTDNALAAGLAAQDPGVKLVGEPIDPEPYGVAMAPGSPDLVRRVNRILAAYEAGPNSGWKQSYDHWLSADLGPTSGPPTPQYRRER